MRSLLVALASEAELAGELTVVWTITNIIDMGRRERLLEDMLGAEGDKELNGEARRKLGLELKRWRGRVLQTVTSKPFRFGSRHQKRGTEYPLEWL